MLPLGANAGSYRRPVIATGTVAYQPNLTVFNLSGTCYDIPLFDLCTSERIGSAYDCVSNVVRVPDCTGGANVTVTTIFQLAAAPS